MTSEIAIMNKTAIALAADSAVTVTGRDKQKVHNTANKLFGLSKHHPVGIMVYGAAELIDVPWETIIKVYRKELGNKSFNHLEEYAEHFIGFFNRENYLFPIEPQRSYFRFTVYYFFYLLKDSLEGEIKSLLNSPPISESQIVNCIEEFLIQENNRWESYSNLSNREINFAHFKNDVEEAVTKVFENLPLTKKAHQNLLSICKFLFSKQSSFQSHSGIVIAGFGDRDVFPSLRSFDLGGILENQLVYSVNDKVDISQQKPSEIMPFAQDHSVRAFIRGIDPKFEDLLITYVQNFFGQLTSIMPAHVPQEFSTNFFQGLNEYMRKNHVGPVYQAIQSLPKEELASMAESLVNLASIKQRISNDTETVGGPIDVAVISKGDGFVWIKRKHYFKPELNPHYFSNHYNILEGEKRK